MNRKTDWFKERWIPFVGAIFVGWFIGIGSVYGFSALLVFVFPSLLALFFYSVLECNVNKEGKQ